MRSRHLYWASSAINNMSRQISLDACGARRPGPGPIPRPGPATPTEGWMTSVTPDRETTAAGAINIDRTSPVPLYFQLAQHYEAAIRSGALKVGSRLDNEVQ